MDPHVMVLAGGRDEQGHDAVAVWLADAAGVPLSGWVYRTDRIHRHATTAARLIDTAGHTVLAGWRPDGTLDLWERLTHAAGRPGTPPPATRAGVADVLTDIRRRRAEYVRVMSYGPRIARLMWETPVPAVGSAAELSAAAGLAPHGRCPVVDRALGVLDQLRWCSRVWRETERIRLGWPVLRRRYGPARPNPPYWDQRLRAAARTRAPR